MRTGAWEKLFTTVVIIILGISYTHVIGCDICIWWGSCGDEYEGLDTRTGETPPCENLHCKRYCPAGEGEWYCFGPFTPCIVEFRDDCSDIYLSECYETLLWQCKCRVTTQKSGWKCRRAHCR